MRIISWNIRGMGNTVKKRFLCKLIKERGPDIVMVQESKIERFEKSVIQRLWGNADVEFAESGSDGSSGGILTMWKANVFKSTSRIVHSNFILLTGTFQGFECVLVNVYAPNDSLSRRNLWAELLHLKSLFQEP